MSRTDRPLRHGFAVIEVLIGFVIVAIAGVGFVTLLGETSHTMSEVYRSERDTEAASALLDRLEIASPSELAAALGVRRTNGFDVVIIEPANGLFDIVVADTLTGGSILHTSLYAPDSTTAP
jgi:Tfp pilus assembly protein PilV